MNIITLPSGKQVDVDTGEIVGAAQAAPVPAGQLTQTGRVDIEGKGAARTAVDALQQFSAGFNTMLFSLPDATIRAVAKAANVKDDEIPQFVNYFNRGQTAPTNALERFAYAIGAGAGSALPFTGLLGAVARTNVLRSALPADAGVARRVAKDMLDFTRANPAGAVAMDLGFGGAYGGLEQSVEEFADPGEAKDFLKATVPFAGTVAIPLAASKIISLASSLPSVQAAKGVAGVGQQMFGSQTAEGFAAEIGRERALNIPFLRSVTNYAGRKYAEKAERDVEKVLAPLVESPGKAMAPGVREALQVTDAIENDPRLKELFLFDAGEQSLYAPLIVARNKMFRELAGDLLADAQVRYQKNREGFLTAFDRFAPNAEMNLDKALQLTYADQTRTVNNALKQLTDLQEGEAARVMDNFVPQNLDEIGESLRSGVLAQMSAKFQSLRRAAENIGAREGFDVEGVKIPTIQEGAPIYPLGISAADYENFGRSLVNRYRMTKEDRMFPDGTPHPVQLMQNQLRRLEDARNKAAAEYIPDIVRQKIMEDPDGPKVLRMMQESEVKNYLDKATQFVLTGKMPRSTTPPRRGTVQLQAITGGDTPPFTKDQVEQIRDEARKMAMKDVSTSMTFPDALDLLDAAQTYRNISIHQYNRLLGLGTPRNQATQTLDRGNALLRDVENFIFTNFKGVRGDQGKALRNWMDEYKAVYTDGYEKAFPLLISKRDPRGNFYTGNEELVNKAFSSAQNIRDLNAIFGQDPAYMRTMTNVLLDKARVAPGVIKDGIIDPEAFQKFLSSKNIKSVYDAMPDQVKANVSDEMKIGIDMARRVKEMQDRVDLARDDELMAILKKSVRPDADPNALVQQAITDPAVMRKLVNAVGAEPPPGVGPTATGTQRKEALQRQVWDTVRNKLMDQSDPLFLQDFLTRHSKSLNILYDKQHLDDLQKLAEIQRRVFAGEAPVGTISPFTTLDEALREKIGAGIGTIEATARAAMIRQISPMHAGVTLASRYLSRQQNAIYETVLYKALTDPEYAHQLVNANKPITDNKTFNTMSKLTFQAGGYLPALMQGGARVAGIEATQALSDQERQVPSAMPVIPPRPAQTAPAVPAANQRLSQSTPARTLPQMPSQGDMQNLAANYAALFPQDFLSPMLQQRQQMPQP